MNNRTLGLLAIIGAPFLCIDFLIHGMNASEAQYEHTSLSGFFSVIYITAWMCSIIVMQRMKLTGETMFGKFILVFQLITLTLANVWNIYEIIAPGSSGILYNLLDMFWPVSNLVLLITGVTILKAGRLQGWKRFVPLLAGIWLPLSVLLMILIGQNSISMVLSGFYSALMWMTLGYVVFTNSKYEIVPSTWYKYSSPFNIE